jgi:hypothetical protein
METAMVDQNNEELGLFAVPSEKLVLMSACTFGLYCWYWLFQNWSRICKIRNRSFSPLVRTWLFPHYNRSLFEEIKALAKEKGLQVGWSATGLSVGFLLFLIGWFSPYTVFISIFVGVILVPVNNTCGQLNETNGFEESWEGFKRKDWIIIILGGILVIQGFLKLALHSGFLQSLFNFLQSLLK